MARKTKKKKESLKGWCAIGFDVSMSSISGAGMMYDRVLDKMRGPALIEHRWQRGTHYFKRLEDCVNAHVIVHDLIWQLAGGFPERDDIYIAVEEPWPMGIVKRAQSQWLKQQAQMTGAFLGGLVRWGYSNVYEINNQTWKKIVADELDISTRDPQFKWRTKEWAIEAFGVEDLPDLIQTKDGLAPKPATSKAKPVQPQDVYDALAIMAVIQAEIGA